MNQHLHRLVFSRRHGMLLAVAETSRGCGKSASGERSAGNAPLLLAAAAALALPLPAVMAQTQPQTRPPVVFASKLPAPATNLPVPYGSSGSANTFSRPFVYDPAKGSAAGDLAASGRVRWSVQGNTGSFDQGSVERVVVNWDSFNIGAGYKVHFTQDKDPAKYVSALNRIWSADPSLIFGSLTADREVILLNANGVYFGRGARVDTGKFVASSLSIADSVFDKGLRNVTDGSAVFSTAGTDYLPSKLDAAVSVEAGAEIRSAAGGDVLLIAPRVVNQGRIATPSGQAVLAAGDKVYLMSSSDPAQRGLIVAVDAVQAGGAADSTLGTVENSATGSTSVSGTGSTNGLVNQINEIRAESGTVNLVGLTVRQKGAINATTAVKGANGAIYLQAMASTAAISAGNVLSPNSAAARGLQIEPGAQVRVGAALGTVEIGAGSHTAVTPDASGKTQLDAEVFNPSRIRVEGKSIVVAEGASLQAPAGKIELLAAADAIANPVFDNAATLNNVLPDGSRIVIAPGAGISAAGLTGIEIDGARNQGSQRLFRIELADAPVQRSGPLYRSQVYFDLRDGSKITAANVTGVAAAVGRTASERSTAGGSVRVEAQGAVVLGQDTTLDVSGGSVRYGQTILQSSVVERDGRLIAFKSAGAGNALDALLATPQRVVTPAYTEGKNGGTLTLSGSQLALADASLKGAVVQGERQRDGSSARAAAAGLEVGRGAGVLNFLQGVALAASKPPATGLAIFADPLGAPLDGISPTTVLPLSTVAGGSFGKLTLRANDISQPGFGTLDLGVAGVLDLQASRTLALDGRFSAAGGRISLQSQGDITLSAATRLNTAGLWTNDSAGVADAASAAAPVQVNGGSISASAISKLTAEAGAALDASGGAWLNSGGSLKTGTAGAVSLSGSTVAPLGGVQMAAFDFAAGGTLALAVPDLSVGGSSSSFTLDPLFFSQHGFGSITVNTSGNLLQNTGDVRVLSGANLAPSLLNWELAAGHRSARSGAFSPAVATARSIDPQLADRRPVNLSFNAGRQLAVYGGSNVVVERGAAIVLEPEGKLTLSATRNLDIGVSGGQVGQTTTLAAPGGSIELAIKGIRGAESRDQDPTGFIGDEALWLGAGARLSVAGLARLRPDSALTLVDGSAGSTNATPLDQRAAGSVLGGGSIKLLAQRGYVVADAGSTMNLDGASALLNVPGVSQAVQLARPAGTLSVSTVEGFVLDGSISARAPANGGLQPLADGGRLSLDVAAGGNLAETNGRPYPDTRFDINNQPIPGGADKPRTILVGKHDGLLAATGAAVGQDLSSTLGNGVGYLRSALLEQGGFSGLTLAAGNQIRFDSSLALNMPLGVQLNAPAVGAAPGAQVSLTTAYAQLGDASPGRIGPAPDRSAAADTSGSGTTSLTITAPTVELYGNWGLQGFSNVLLDAGAAPNGEIRLSGVQVGQQPTGALAFAGRLDLAAGQVYATSGTAYALNGLPATVADDPGSTLAVRTGAAGRATATPLSAFGALSASATTIEQRGVLRQPFGSIALAAERSLVLGDGSITSVSGQGATLPYGITANLTQWTLPQGNVATALPRDKTVSLSAGKVLTSPTATVDASGGGVVQASEFFPGVGGSKDYFETAGPNALYAVLPAHAATQALALQGGKLDAAQQGRQIVITTAGSGLPPGTYTLLPARYALLGGALPGGAFLVSRAADQGKSVLRTALQQDDGSVVVSGYLRDVGSVNVGAPGERFVVEPQATFLAKSETRLTDISQLLSERARTLGAASAALLPRDAGQVQVTVSGTGSNAGSNTGSNTAGNTWQAALDLRASGGLAGLLDMSATRLALVDDLSKTPDGALGISADVLARSGAGSVLLGGRRTLSAAAVPTTGSTAATEPAAPTWAIDQSATSAVTVDLGTRELKVEELLLAARDSVRLAAGSRISASGAATLGARTLASAGDGALLAVSANPLALQRSGVASTGGDLRVGAGSVLAGRQVSLDASNALQVDGTAALQAQALGLAARRIVVGGGGAADASASTLDGALLATVRATPDISLRAYDSIDFIGRQHWADRGADANAAPAHVATRLVLDAPLLRGLAAADGTAASTDIAAQSIVLRNSSGRSASVHLASPTGQGTLLLQALPPLRYGSTGGMALGPGNLALGFDSVALRSAGDIVLQGDGSTTAQQDITLSAARLTATSGAAQSLVAAGLLRVAPEAGSRTLGERVGQGATLQLSGQTVQQQGRIALPGGNLTLQASGADSDSAAIGFGVGSSTSVAGFTLTGPLGFDAFGRAGNISATATQGRIELLGTLDASAAPQGSGDAGRITLDAAGAGGALLLSQTQAGGSIASGSLLARAGTDAADRGGRLAVDVATMPSADALALASTAGGFSREVALRVRSGDVALNSDIHAQRITLSADGGALALGSTRATTLDAASPGGGVVQLAAGGDLRLADATRIDARSTRAGANGGDVLLSSSTGRVRLAAGASVDATGDDAQDGRIVLRALRGSDNRSVNVDALDTSRLKGGEVDVEAVRRYTGITTIAAGNSSGSTLGQTTLRNDSATFMNAKAGILSALGVAAAETGRVNLRAGVEVQAGGNLTVNGDWALNADRPGGDAGFLSLRAAGNLLLNGSISDGFSTAAATGVLNDNARSWSYRLAAGADLAAANPLAVKDFSAAPSEAAGNLTVSANRMLRTGAGSIEMAAGRDILFAGSGSNTQGLAYVAGRKSAQQPGVLATLFSGQSAKPTFTEQGGRLALSAARDVFSAEANQLVNNWLWRSGTVDGDSYAANGQLASWTEFSRFRQTLGSFGGGGLTVNAGRDVINLQAMAPTAAWADSRLVADASLQVRNGGDLSVNAGRDLLGGQYLLGRGDGHLRAEGDVGAAAGNLRSLKRPVLALLDGRWDVAAGGDAAIGSTFDPTAFPASSVDSRATVSSFFFTWGNSSGVTLNATAGSASVSTDEKGNAQTFAAYGVGGGPLVVPDLTRYLQILPASLRVTAATGAVDLLPRSSNAVLFPSSQGALEVWAGSGLALGSRLAMADTQPAVWGDYRQPIPRDAVGAVLTNQSGGLLQTALDNTAAGQSLHSADGAPARLHAEGSIQAAASQNAATLVLPKAAEITAGDDILGLQLAGQNLRASDTTVVNAGRNLLAGQYGSITLAGPGALDVAAGRQVDLENSAGITTTGNSRNASLPAQGASVRLAAATAGTLDLAALDASYLQPGRSSRAQQYRDLLLASVRAALQQPALGYDEAWAQFQGFPASAQAAFGRQVLAAEFGAVYLSATPPGAAQMTATLRAAFEQHKTEVLKAGDAALAAGTSLTLPGREVLQGAALAAYLADLRGLAFSSLDIGSAVAARVAALARVHSGWREAVAASLGGSVAGFDALARQDPQAPALLAYQAALQDFSGRRFQVFQQQVLASETASAGAAASLYGRRSLPMRLALFDQGFQAAELAGAGSFVAQPLWPGSTPLMAYSGALEMTQSSVVTERGGGIGLVNAGGAINVGLKDSSDGGASGKGVIALGGGDVFGYAKGDFQVNNQRVFLVGRGDMTVWSSSGDIDSGRGANTAVAAPPLAARRTVDGVVFETPATTTGSGLGILEDAAGNRSGTIGLFPAFGEILALDAFIRAPAVLLGSTIRGADNLQAASVGGAAAPVAAPPVAVAPPTSTESRTVEAQAGAQGSEARQRNALLTVDLLGLGPDEQCSEQDRRDARCPKPVPQCSAQDKAAGQCQ